MSFPVHPSYGPGYGQVFTQQPYPSQQPVIIYQQQPGYQQQQRQNSNCCDCCACCQCCLMCCACSYLLTCWAELCCSVLD
uniref:CYSTM domain-containing protein n=1 Tax=Caenorhabditis tropicalis TaxID=1561998 RepID=A0A1I7UF92_9PELO